MTRQTISSVILALLLPLSSVADEVQERIFQDNLRRAEAGDSNAQFIVGHRYEVGVGTAQDIEKAFQWYNKAAQKGHPLAQRKVESRDESAQKDSRTRTEIEITRKVEQRARVEAEAEARNRSQQQAEAARQKKANEARAVTTEAKPITTAMAGRPVENSNTTAEAVANPMEIVLAGLWQHNQYSSEILPSPNTSCLRTAATEVTCFTGEAHHVVGKGRLAYTVKSVLSNFARDGSFQARYVYNVTDHDSKETGSTPGLRPLSEIKPNLGWQEPGYTASCRASNDRNIQCTTDRKAVVQFTKM